MKAGSTVAVGSTAGSSLASEWRSAMCAAVGCSGSTAAIGCGRRWRPRPGQQGMGMARQLRAEGHDAPAGSLQTAAGGSCGRGLRRGLGGGGLPTTGVRCWTPPPRLRLRAARLTPPAAPRRAALLHPVSGSRASRPTRRPSCPEGPGAYAQPRRRQTSPGLAQRCSEPPACLRTGSTRGTPRDVAWRRGGRRHGAERIPAAAETYQASVRPRTARCPPGGAGLHALRKRARRLDFSSPAPGPDAFAVICQLGRLPGWRPAVAAASEQALRRPLRLSS